MTCNTNYSESLERTLMLRVRLTVAGALFFTILLDEELNVTIVSKNITRALLVIKDRTHTLFNMVYWKYKV